MRIKRKSSACVSKNCLTTLFVAILLIGASSCYRFSTMTGYRVVDKTARRKEKYYMNDVNYSLELNRLFLKPIGAWPEFTGDSNEINEVLRRLLNTICCGLICFLTVPCGLYTFVDEQNVKLRLRLIGPLSYCLMAVVKYWSLMFRQKGIKQCLDHIKDDWKNVRYREDRIIMLENAKFGRRLALICAVFVYANVFFYQTILPYAGNKLEVDNLTFRPLSYPVSRLVIDTRRSPINDIIIPLQCVCGFVIDTVTTAACGLTAVFVMHACGQLQVLMSWLEHLIDGRPNFHDTMNDRLTDIVRHHVRILSFVSLTEDVLSEISLVEVSGCTLNLCLLGYYAITDWSNGERAGTVVFAVLLISFTFNIFIFCYIGELLVEQCKKVGQLSYMVDWYRLKGNKGLALILMIAMSESTSKLTAGKVVELSLNSFGNVIKTAVAYLNVLRTVTS